MVIRDDLADFGVASLSRRDVMQIRNAFADSGEAWRKAAAEAAAASGQRINKNRTAG